MINFEILILLIAIVLIINLQFEIFLLNLHSENLIFLIAMSDQNIAVRLKLLMERLGISNSQFADECKISRPTLSQLITGRNKKVSDVIISQIHSAFPNLSVLWLLFGEGDMWVNNEDPTLKFSDGSAAWKDGNSNVKGGNDRDDDGTISGDEEITIENLSDNSKFRQEGKDALAKSKEKGVNTTSDVNQNGNLQEINVDIKSTEFLNDLAKIKRKCRKVVQITIYYDDSTFESFYPG